MDCRVILFHKHETSARLRFLRFANQSVCALGDVPSLAALHAGAVEGPALHPAQVVRQLEERYGFDSGSIKPEEGFRFYLDVPGENLPVLLMRLVSMDPPFELAQRLEASFIDLTQARGLPTVELELLREAYEQVLGG